MKLELWKDHNFSYRHSNLHIIKDLKKKKASHKNKKLKKRIHNTTNGNNSQWKVQNFIKLRVISNLKNL